jgi:lipoyl(octanoyl) transferase
MAIEYQKLGLVDYRESLTLQENLVKKRIKEEIGDRLLLLEHPPVITQGKRECAEDFCTSRETIQAEGIDIVRTDRGGRLTYHGPGQLIGYFICDVSIADGVRGFVSSIEEMLIRTCNDYGIEAIRDQDHPGVWVGKSKIAAVGLHITRGVSSHGFALNVNCDLEPYTHIVACGIRDRSVTTMEKVAGRKVSMENVVKDVVSHTSLIFDRSKGES